ncbi:MAG: flavodoxin-dependent (E)-4-hydroxy-3-methylbut-2-enyl-diphosphate synthase [Oscillospiraceae bacterium]|nr:flavodoxin-dependent (E)-4-hydroxy-3-methylbut-2-enyl-diphosphate synthase [Candidatus Equicaccousia limihippi]
MTTREKTKSVKIKNIIMGGNDRVYVQSMLNKPASDAKGNLAQALELQAAGCELIRLSVPDKESLKTVELLKQNIDVPLVADIHFDYRLAVECAKLGIDKIRINPGNIGSSDGVKQVASICSQKNIPIRIGVNSGSVKKEYLEKYGVCARSLFESAMGHVRLLNQYGFDDIVLSLKSSNVQMMYDAYILAANNCDYPLHLGVTEAGTALSGTLKSAVGIGGLLLAGMGNTVRVSLTDEPIKEIAAANQILKAAGIKKEGIKIVSCPTCGRTKIDLIGIAQAAEKALENTDKNLTVAIMGCAVNGPGEAREADIGIAGGDKEGILFKKGEIIKKVPETQLLSALLQEIEKM